MDHSPGFKKSNLGNVVKKGIAWTLTSRGLIFLFGFGTTVILARLLEPVHFGIFGMVMIFIGLANRFGNIGLGAALIQRSKIDDTHISTLFVVNLFVFISICIILVLFSPLLSSFFETPEVEDVLKIAALVFIASPFSSVARVVLQRRMDFKGTAIASVIDHYSGAIVSIALAIAGQGVWSLVYGQLFGCILRTAYMMAKAKWVPRFYYCHSAMKDLFSFGFKIFLKNFLIFTSDKTDLLIIGKQLGPSPLGLYEKAFKLMEVGPNQVSDKIGPVLFSAFSKLQDDKPRLISAYNKAILTISLLTYPIFFGINLVAPSLIYVLFGEKWLPSVFPLQILCLAGVMRTHIWIIGTIVNSMGKAGVEVWMRSLALVLLGIGCWIGSSWGIVGVSVAVTIVSFLLVILMAYYFCKLLKFSFLEFIRPQSPALIAVIIMYFVVFMYHQWAENALGIYSISMLISSIGIGGFCYAAVLLILRPGPVVGLYREFLTDLDLVKRKYAKKIGSNM